MFPYDHPIDSCHVVPHLTPPSLRMASYYNVYQTLMIIMAFMPSPLLSSYSQPSPKVPTLSSSPATLTDPPPSSLSPFQELSPDIAPLLPSPGGVLPTPTGSDIPTIPSNPSPPNPDDIIAPGPLSAFSPFGSMQASSTAPRTLVASLATTVFAGLAVYWSLLCMREDDFTLRIAGILLSDGNPCTLTRILDCTLT
ncbi:hypothetical protein CR513_29105, partial [Mucuna pruriens]